MKFIYRSKGSVDDWHEETIEAKSKKEALAKLEEMYGVRRDKDGKQTNTEYIQVEIVKQVE